MTYNGTNISNNFFRFKKDKFDINLLSEDLVIKVKPGLSSFSTDPEKAVDSIQPLLDKAIEVIPKSEHAITRLTLKATAGLRMVSDEIAYEILNNV